MLLLFLSGWIAAGCATREGVASLTNEREPVVTKIVLLHDNDLHFDMNYRTAFEETIAGFREQYENVFLLNAGDIFVRHQSRWPDNDPAFYEQRSRYMIEAMNAVGYDAATLGNHDLDLKGTVTRDSLRLADFPLLGANVSVETDAFDPPQAYTILETDDGYTVAVLGLTGGGIGDDDGIVITDHKQALQDHLYLRDEHDVLVLLTHIGYRADRALAGEFPQVDVILGGHSHTLLNPSETINGVLVAQAGGHPHQIMPVVPKMLGAVKLRLEDGRVTDKSGRVLIIIGGER